MGKASVSGEGKPADMGDERGDNEREGRAVGGDEDKTCMLFVDGRRLWERDVLVGRWESQQDQFQLYVVWPFSVSVLLQSLEEAGLPADVGAIPQSRRQRWI